MFLYRSLMILIILVFSASSTVFAKTAKECKRQITKQCSSKSYKSLSKRVKCYRKIHKKLPKDCKKINRRLIASAKKKLKAKKAEETSGSGWLYFLIFFIILILWLEVCMYGIFSKARYNPWLAFVPFYNSYIFHKIAGVPPLWCVANLTPALFYFWPQTCNSLAESFGQDEEMGKIIAALPFVYLAILGFNPHIQYEGKGSMPDISFDLKL